MKIIQTNLRMFLRNAKNIKSIFLCRHYRPETPEEEEGEKEEEVDQGHGKTNMEPVNKVEMT